MVYEQKEERVDLAEYEEGESKPIKADRRFLLFFIANQNGRLLKMQMKQMAGLLHTRHL